MSAPPLAVRLLLVVVAFAAGGVVAGVVWHGLWDPPTGVVFQDEWLIDSTGAPEDVAGTGWYVVVAAVAGVGLGLVVALLTKRHEVATLAATVVGSTLAGVLMALTGHLLGPPDPRPLAAGRPDFTAIEADLRVEGRSPYLAFPAGALTALALGFIALNGSPRFRLDREPRG